MVDGGAQWDYHSDVEEDSEFDASSKQALIIAVSATPDMFRPWSENDEKPIVAALKVCDSLLRSKIISSPKDKVAIMLFGTEFSKNSSSFDHLYVLQELSTVNCGVITEIHKMINSSDLNGFEDKIGSSSQLDLKNAFWLSKIIYDEGDAKSMSKSIMLITNDDDPHSGNDNLRRDAIQKFKDLGKVDFSVVTFNENFDPAKFYKDILEDDSAVTYAHDLGSLLKVVRMKQRLKRPITRSTLAVAPALKCAVGVYSLIRKAPKPKQIKINKRTNEPVQKETTQFDESGLPVLKSEVKKSVTLCGKTAEFTPAELKDMKYNFETGISVLAFVDKSQYDPFSWYRSPGYFIYPDDERIHGSKELFTTLLKRCNALEKVVLVELVLTRGANPKLGCLIPCVEEHSRVGPNFPQGFFLAVLPFSGDIRDHDPPEGSPAPNSLVEKMESVVKKLTQKNFSVSEAHNPELHAMWKEIESAALNLPRDAEEFQDFTQPNVDLMQHRIGLIVGSINADVATLVPHQPKAKTARVAKPPPVDFDMKNECLNNRLEKLTVATLKAFTDGQNIEVPQRGKFNPPKKAYIDAINKYYENV